MLRVFLLKQHTVLTGAYDGTVRWRGHVQMSVDIFIYGAIEFIVAFRRSVVAFRVSVDRL